MMQRRPSPLLPTNGWAGAGSRRQRGSFSENIKRVLFLAGIAVVLIYCGLSFTSLSGAKRGGFRVFTGGSTQKSARALAEENAQLQQPQRAPVLSGLDASDQIAHTDFDGHNHGPDEPCDESCQKHHSHLQPNHQDVHTEPARLTVGQPLASPLYSMAADGLDGQPVALKAYAGKVLLVTNVASQCGYTEQNYQGLQRLYDKYRDRGFEVLAWPCNQFGHQEPGDSATISEFVKSKYHITFPVFAKVEVNGPGAHPVFNFLKSVRGPEAGDAANWNFNKYLVDRRGFPVRHYASGFEEVVLEADIAAELERPAGDSATSTA